MYSFLFFTWYSFEDIIGFKDNYSNIFQVIKLKLENSIVNVTSKFTTL